MYDNMYQLVVKEATKGTAIYESINVRERVSRKTTEFSNAAIQQTRRGKLPVEKPPVPKVLSQIKKYYLQSPFRARVIDLGVLPGQICSVQRLPRDPDKPHSCHTRKNCPIRYWFLSSLKAHNCTCYIFYRRLWYVAFGVF